MTYWFRGRWTNTSTNRTISGIEAIPNLKVFRPADINETLECWEAALNNISGPSALVLSRQKLPYITSNFSEKTIVLKELIQLKLHLTIIN